MYSASSWTSSLKRSEWPDSKWVNECALWALPSFSVLHFPPHAQTFPFVYSLPFPFPFVFPLPVKLRPKCNKFDFGCGSAAECALGGPPILLCAPLPSPCQNLGELTAVIFTPIWGCSPGPKNPFLCPDGRVATGEGRLAQWGRTKFVVPPWASRPTKLATKHALIFTVTNLFILFKINVAKGGKRHLHVT